MKASKRLLGALGALLAASLACSVAPERRDIVATVNAVSTSVQATLAVQAPAPSLTPPAPTQPPPDTATSPPASATPPPPATGAASTAPSPAPETPTSPAGLLRPNAPLLHAARRSAPPQIDGDLGEWSLADRVDQPVFQPANWSGVGDHSVDFALAWDDVYLYLAARVTDDFHVQTQTGESIYKGDSLEMLVDADLAGDFVDERLGADDFQLGFSPGAASSSPEAYLWFPQPRQGTPAGVVVAARPAGSGYTLEAAIPWRVIDFTPRAEARLGFTFSASDNDTPDSAQQQSLISNVLTRRLSNPTSWGTLILDP